jgi:hypothetical protein
MLNPSPEQVIHEMAWLAHKASRKNGRYGIRKDIVGGMLPQRMNGIEYYCNMNVICVYARVEDGQIRLPDNVPKLEHQPWAGAYPTWQHLMDSAIMSLTSQGGQHDR